MFIQYQNAPKFKELLDRLKDYLTIPIQQFYEHFFNIDTADTQGLNNWGLILGQSRTVGQYSLDGVFGFGKRTFPKPPTYPLPLGYGVFGDDLPDPFEGAFGFSVDTYTPPEPMPAPNAYPQPFDYGVFYGGTNTNTKKSTLTNDQYRAVLKLLYQTYTVDCSLASCEEVVNNYIQEQYNNPILKCNIIEGDMFFTYQFNFTLQPWEISLFKLTKILPKPAGIAYYITWGV